MKNFLRLALWMVVQKEGACPVDVWKPLQEGFDQGFQNGHPQGPVFSYVVVCEDVPSDLSGQKEKGRKKQGINLYQEKIFKKMKKDIQKTGGGGVKKLEEELAYFSAIKGRNRKTFSSSRPRAPGKFRDEVQRLLC
jgi:hypothetical protein